MPTNDSQHYQLLAQLIDALLKDKGLRPLASLINKDIPFSDYFITLFKEGSAPLLFAHGNKQPRKNLSWFSYRELEGKAHGTEPFDIYITGPYLLDPFYQYWLKGAPEGFYRLVDIEPDGFKTSEYFQTHLNLWNLDDEGGFLIPLTSDITMHFSLGRDKNHSKYTVEESTALNAMLPLIKTAATLVLKANSSIISEQAEKSTQFHKQLENKFKAFGTSVLTEREVEITHLLLKGYASKSIAKLTHITPATVRTHFKNIFRKLQISSQQELFGLFIEALGNKSQTDDQDPLVNF